MKALEKYLLDEFGATVESASVKELYHGISRCAMGDLKDRWVRESSGKRACFFSAEFLMGRMINNNLMNLGVLDDYDDYLKSRGVDIRVFEQVEDHALGNGGLGRLAACFLDSAATCGIPLDGYGIRYRYGLFKQSIVNGFQKEEADDWLVWGDPWSIRREMESVTVRFADHTVRAVPYDMPVIGWDGIAVNNLRLWQAEPLQGLDFEAFNRQDYGKAMEQGDKAAAISAVLYPNDDSDQGKILRLKQEYFLSSASIQSILRSYTARHGDDFVKLPEFYRIQLNDTHPVMAIPELLRILMDRYGMDFGPAFDIVQKTFAYTNHTIMAEAMEQWDVNLLVQVVPDVYPYIVMIDNALKRELAKRVKKDYQIVKGGKVRMANLAVYASLSTNGVAGLHTEILKEKTMKHWYELYPDRFSNKTNGISQRRWLRLCNPELSGLITELVGDGWITDLTKLEGLKPYAGDRGAIDKFAQVKREKKIQLAKYVLDNTGVGLSPDMIFDVQIKRLHEYKRQLMNALSIMDAYFGVKQGLELYPTAYIFAAKAAPGYDRAKAVIKLIHEIARMINSDPAVRNLMRVVFIPDYNVSLAERIIPAANISQQISTTGTEASGTGNMKMMLNGAVTMGTPDGANVEIVKNAGEENNYIFGPDIDQFTVGRESYDPQRLYRNDPRIKRAVDVLIDGTFDDGATGAFNGLYRSLMYQTYNSPDHYHVLSDLMDYCDIRQKANRDYSDGFKFHQKCWLNTASAGEFSSDRTVRQYASEIWGL